MKIKLIVLLFCGISLLSFGQTNYYHYTSDYYRVSSDLSESHAARIARKMESSLSMFNSLFHFDLTDLNVKMKVTIFSEKDSFDEYLESTIGRTRQDFTFIHYSDLAKSELVGFIKTDEFEFDASLIHQGLIQFLKAFIPNPPIWLREGAAAYFEASLWNENTLAYDYRSNYAWLPTLRALLKGEVEGKTPLMMSDLLNRESEPPASQMDIFYPQAWGVVTFLLETPENEYNRILWDSLSVIDPVKTVKENSQAVMQKAFKWVDERSLLVDFTSFVDGLKTFNELITSGVALYSQGELDDAAASFNKAVVLEPESYIPPYYLGLINYADKDHIKAEGYYTNALDLGSDVALTNYALGVNAFAGNRYEQAVLYLSKAKAADPVEYSEKVDVLLQRIETLR